MEYVSPPSPALSEIKVNITRLAKIVDCCNTQSTAVFKMFNYKNAN